jgi:GNAT superfamily N-acetyltransferase
VANEIELAVEAVVAWHDSWLHALGCRTAADEDAWRAIDRPPIIYFSAMTRRLEAPPESVADTRGGVCDSWNRLDLAPFGFEIFGTDPWFFRPAEPLPEEAAPRELEIVRVTTAEEIEEFELVSVRGFGNEDATVEPGSIHPPSILADSRMVNWIGRVEGRPVAAAGSYVTDDAVGIFGVTTVASMRGRGYGTALTRAAMLVEAGLPAVLDPSREAESMYERLGFRAVGVLRKWTSA